MASILRAYNSALIRRPVAAQSATAATLFGLGDVLSQQAIEKKGSKHDFMRTLRLAGYGGMIFAPIVSRWYTMLQRIQFKSQPAVVAARVGLDQFALTPVMVGVFFTSMSIFEGKGLDEAKRRLSNSYTPTLIRNWGLFIPVQVLNFAIVPPHLRLVVVNVVSLFWNAYLSYANQASQSAAAKVSDAAGPLKQLA